MVVVVVVVVVKRGAPESRRCSGWIPGHLGRRREGELGSTGHVQTPIGEKRRTGLEDRSSTGADAAGHIGGKSEGAVEPPAIGPPERHRILCVEYFLNGSRELE